MLSKITYVEYVVFNIREGIINNNFTIYFSFPLIFYIELEVSLYSKEENSLLLSDLSWERNYKCKMST